MATSSPRLSAEYLQKLCGSPSTTLPVSTLVELLSEIEGDAALIIINGVTAKESALVESYYAALMIALLLSDDLEEARHVVERFNLQKALSTSGLVADVEVLIRAVRARQYASIYEAFRQGRWSPSIIVLIERYHSYIVESTFKLISRAYTAMPADQAMHYLDYRKEDMEGKSVANGGGRPGDDFVSRVTAYGWSWDPKTNLFHPKPVVDSIPSNSGPSQLEAESIARLISLVGFLESQG